jgi:predicted MPP superfamily phosphohydrolase
MDGARQGRRERPYQEDMGATEDTASRRPARHVDMAVHSEGSGYRPRSRLLHVSDLHAGRRETPGVEDALAELAGELGAEAILATGDLAHRGRRTQLETGRAALEAAGVPVVAVPGNHDIPYTFPARFSRPWAEWERTFGNPDPVYRSETLVVVGLNSVRPWRHQSGRLAPSRLQRVAAELRDVPSGALRVVACHHHLAGSPWRAPRKRPLAHRSAALDALVAAGTELVAGGHIHQASISLRPEFEAMDGDRSAAVVLATAPGLGRPRPHRQGEAQGLLVYEWDESELAIVTYVWQTGTFRPVARRSFPRDSNPTEQEDERTWMRPTTS